MKKKIEDLQERSNYLTKNDLKKTFFTRKLDQKSLGFATITFFPHTQWKPSVSDTFQLNITPTRLIKIQPSKQKLKRECKEILHVNYCNIHTLK